MELLSTKLLSLISLYPQRHMATKMELLQYKSESIELQIWEKTRQRDELNNPTTPESTNTEDPALKSRYQKQLNDQAQQYENDIHQQAILLQRNTRMHQQLETECVQLRSQKNSLDTLVKEKSRLLDEQDNKISRLNYDIRDQQKRAATSSRSPSPFSNNREFEAEKNRLKHDFQVREDQWTSHTHQMEDQFDELLDNFDKLTNTAIEFDSHRMRYDKRLDTLNRQRNQLEMELIEEKVKKIGYGQQGELAPTTQALRKEFRLLVADIKKTHQQRLDQEADEIRRLQMQLEELQKDTNNSHYKYQHSMATQT
jgi:chromosome segregation ATPase